MAQTLEIQSLVHYQENIETIQRDNFGCSLCLRLFSQIVQQIYISLSQMVESLYKTTCIVCNKESAEILDVTTKQRYLFEKYSRDSIEFLISYKEQYTQICV